MDIFEFDPISGHVGEKIGENFPVVELYYRAKGEHLQSIKTRKNFCEHWTIVERAYWPSGNLVKFDTPVAFCIGPVYMGRRKEAKVYHWIALVRPPTLNTADPVGSGGDPL